MCVCVCVCVCVCGVVTHKKGRLGEISEKCKIK